MEDEGKVAAGVFGKIEEQYSLVLTNENTEITATLNMVASNSLYNKIAEMAARTKGEKLNLHHLSIANKIHSGK